MAACPGVGTPWPGQLRARFESKPCNHSDFRNTLTSSDSCWLMQGQKLRGAALHRAGSSRQHLWKSRGGGRS